MVSNLSDANPRRHAANVGQKVTVLDPGLGLYQQMSKLDILAAVASTITQLTVVAVSTCVHAPVSESLCVCLCAPVYVCVSVCLYVCIPAYACAHTLPEAPAASALLHSFSSVFTHLPFLPEPIRLIWTFISPGKGANSYSEPCMSL